MLNPETPVSYPSTPMDRHLGIQINISHTNAGFPEYTLHGRPLPTMVRLLRGCSSVASVAKLYQECHVPALRLDLASW